MAAKKQAAKAGAAVAAVRTSPYVQRLVEDEELRQYIWQAYESSRDAYARLSNGKSPSQALFEDKKLQKDLQTAAGAIRDASVALREGPKRKQRRGGFGKKLLLLLVAGGAALALSEGLRKKVLDALFGAEEEFEYTSPTTASSSSTGATAGATA